MTANPLVRLEVVDHVAQVTLNRPDRHNSLVPDMIAQLNATLAEVRERELFAMVLTGAGRSFSTGGDVAAFLAVPRAERRAYAKALVGGLNNAILELISMPMPVIARLNGPVTGGSLGLALAADLSAISETAFIAPYYVDVGFAPDGGWTAMLPERIGPAKARAIQLLNRHITSQEAVLLGIATEAAAAERIDPLIDGWIATLATKVSSSVRATRELLMPRARQMQIAERLQHELDRFLEEIDSEAAEAGMKTFLAVA